MKIKERVAINSSFGEKRIIINREHSSRLWMRQRGSFLRAEFQMPTMCIVCRPLAQPPAYVDLHAKGPHARFPHSQCSVGARGERTQPFLCLSLFPFFRYSYFTLCVSENVWICSVAFIQKRISKCYIRELSKELLSFVEREKKGGKIFVENTWLVIGH